MSELPRPDYASILRLIHMSTTDHAAVCPCSMGNWRVICARFDLAELSRFPAWLAALFELQQRSVETHGELGLFAHQDAPSGRVGAPQSAYSPVVAGFVRIARPISTKNRTGRRNN